MEKPSEAPQASSKNTDPPAAEKPKPTISEIVAKHVASVAEMEKFPDDHLLVSEHAAAAGLKSWQMAAFIARFHTCGVHMAARMSKDVFDQALHITLHGRI
jgi:aminoglycoside phosphotransferase family enzyme